MEIKNKVSVFLILLAFCTSIHGEVTNENYDIYANRLLNKASQEIGRDLGIKCVGSGGSMPYGIDHLSLFFETYKPADVDRARKMEIQAIAKFLSLINSDEKIRPFLNEYPFPVSRIFLMISFIDKSKESNTLADVHNAKDFLVYDKRNKENNKREVFLKEKYEDAIKLAKGLD